MEYQCDILAIGWAENNSGFSRVFESIFKRLCSDFRIVHFGINYRGERLEHKWIVEPNTVRGDLLGQGQLEALLLRYKPKVVFICHDYWLYQAHSKVLGQFGMKTIYYCPVDNKMGDDDRVKALAGIEKLIFYNQYGRDTFLEEWASCDISDLVFDIDVIPHSVDTNTFYPLSMTKAEIRAALFPDRPELHDAFIILNANKNVERKRIDLSINAFAEFLKTGNRNAYLYLHMSAVDMGVDLRRQIKALDIEDYVLFPDDPKEKPAVSDEQLNLIYNACDVGVNTCQGEGWGLVAFEHAAAGKCQVVPNHTACRELWGGAGILIPVDHTNTVDVASLTEIFAALYSNPELFEQKSLCCYQKSQDTKLSCDAIARHWKAIFQSAVVSENT